MGELDGSQPGKELEKVAAQFNSLYLSLGIRIGNARERDGDGDAPSE